MATAGAVQTQWWSQLIGESSRPVSAAPSRPATWYPARSRIAAQAMPAIPTTTATAIHSVCELAMLPTSRVMRPRSDWLPSQPVNPVRPPCMNRPPNHHLTESPRCSAKPSSTVNAKAPDAMKACRNLRAKNRYGMKTSGTSLMPAAMPTPAPFHQRLFLVSGWHRSHRMSAISTRLTWPRYKVRMTGSVQNTAAEASRVAPRRTRGRSR